MWRNRTKSDKNSPDFLSLHGATPAYITSRLPRRLRRNIFPCPSAFQLLTPDTEYDANICTHVTCLFASINYTLKKKKTTYSRAVTMATGAPWWGEPSQTVKVITGCISDSREGWQTSGETETLLSIFIPAHSSFDVLRVTQQTLRSLPHRRGDCWLTQEPYVDALHLRTCSIFESSWPCFK